MKTDLYSKIMLTVIAGCMIVIVVQQARIKPAQPEPPFNLPSPLPVTIAGVISSQTLNVRIRDIVETRIKAIDPRTTMPIKISLQAVPLDVNISHIGNSIISGFGQKMGENTLPVRIVQPQ